MQMRFLTPMRGLAAALLVCAFAIPASAQPRGKKTPKAPKATPAAATPKDDAPATPDAAPADTAPAEPKAPKGTGKANTSPKTYDFNSLDLNGRMRTPQLLYFLERANEELERASLEKRSFIPHMVRSVDEEAL